MSSSNERKSGNSPISFLKRMNIREKSRIHQLDRWKRREIKNGNEDAGWWCNGGQRRLLSYTRLHWMDLHRIPSSQLFHLGLRPHPLLVGHPALSGTAKRERAREYVVVSDIKPSRDPSKFLLYRPIGNNRCQDSDANCTQLPLAADSISLVAGRAP